MPPTCTVCMHPDRAAIDKALIAGEPFRRIAERTGASATSLRRHKASHLAGAIVRAEQKRADALERQVVAIEDKREADDLDVHTELRRIFRRMNKLMDACDAWLTDPDDPTRYDLGPRSHELKVTYEERDDSGDRPVVLRRKKPLSELLATVNEAQPAFTWTLVEHKSADPRKLIVDTANALRPSVELLAKLVGDIDDRPINFFVFPEWQRLQAVIVETLAAFPAARAALTARLAAIGAGTPEEPDDGDVIDV